MHYGVIYGAVLALLLSVAGSSLATTNTLGREWSRIWGSTAVDTAWSVCVSTSGNIYVAGEVIGSFDGQTNAGSADLYLAKFTPAGDRLWSRIWGSSGYDSAWGVGVNSSGGVYVAGYTAGAFDGQTNAGGTDFCLSKFDEDGTRLWSRIWGSTESEDGWKGFGLDPAGGVYISGNTPGAFDGQTNAGMDDLCLTKYDFEGNRLWSRIWGSASNDLCNGSIATDPSGNVYVGGSVGGVVGSETHLGGKDVSLTKLDSAGNLLWTRLWGSVSNDYGYGVALDSTGGVYVVGDTQGSFGGQTNAGSDDLFLSKLDSDGTQLWSRIWGSSSSDGVSDLLIDASNCIYVVGDSGGVLGSETNAGEVDAFVANIDDDGTWQWVRMWGSASNDSAYGVAIDSSNTVYICGDTAGSLDGQPTAVGQSDFSLTRWLDAMVVDSDGDGMPNWWEEWHFGHPTNEAPLGDYDSDGMINGNEYVSDTDPTDVLSMLSFLSAESEVSGLRLFWQGGVAATQFLEWTPSLDSAAQVWTVILTNPAPTTMMANYLDTTGSGDTRFYRLRVTR